MMNSSFKILKYGVKVWSNWAGEVHREDGPAVEWVDGSKFYFRNNVPHRIDGPAFEYAYGKKLWYINGQLFNSEEEWFRTLSIEQKLNMIWNFDEF